ncbi:MAG: tetratricopeptide repeat protein [Pseudomonadales bacterium]|nr:tetratricopeptide repeat protein [Pseudomonadales bacterium]
MPFFILSILLQVALVIHILKTGRSTTWIWIVVMLPLAGAIAYLILEVFPDASNSKTGRQASKTVTSVVKPNKAINAAAQQFSVSDTVENSMKLAHECLNKSMYDDAKTLFNKCLTGPHADDPALLFGLAQACFGLGEFEQVKTTLDNLKELNPDYKNADAHLLYARTLESLNQVSAALHEYEVLHSYFSGPEASFYYGKFLKAQNQHQQADAIFKQVLATANQSGKHYKSLHKDIIKMAKSEVSD